MTRLTADVLSFCIVSGLWTLGVVLALRVAAQPGRPRATLVMLAMGVAILCASFAALAAGVVSRWHPELIRAAGPWLREGLSATLFGAFLVFVTWYFDLLQRRKR